MSLGDHSFSNLYCMITCISTYPNYKEITSQFVLGLERTIVFVRPVGVADGDGFLNLSSIPYECDLSSERFPYDATCRVTGWTSE